MSSHEFLRNTMIYLLAAVVMVPLSSWLGLGSVLGYLVAGVLIGPWVLGLISSPEQVLQFAEFGVVMLLFLIGLELNPRRLWQMRKPIFGMGSLQLVSCAAAIFGLAYVLGWGWRASLIAGLGLAMSSTALALQLLRERNLHQLAAGQASFAVLLFQDLAVIPMIALIPLLAVSGAVEGGGHGAGEGVWLGVIKGVAAIVGVVLGGRYFVRPVFRFVAETGLREMFTAFSLALVFGISFVMHEVGLSMALGAFLAGIVLADSEFRHELEVDIEPFKGLLLGLFFIAVGMSMDFSALIASPLGIGGLVIGLVGLKILMLALAGRFFGYSRGETAIFAVALSQGGEFAFVLFGLARQSGALPPEDAAAFSIAVALSMATTPFLFMLNERWILPRLSGQSAGTQIKPEYEVQSEGNPVILAGFGRIGQVIGRLLHAQKIGVTILERDPSQIEVVRRFGWPAFYGDVTRLELLRAAGAEHAKLLILAIDDMDATQRTISMVKEQFPHLKLMVRAETRIDAYHFINQGVPTVRATFAPGLEMAEEALRILGMPAYESHLIGQRFRRYDLTQLLRSAKHVGDEKTMIAISQESRDELTRIMETDDRRRSDIVQSDGWA